MEATAQSVEDLLVDGLSFKLRPAPAILQTDEALHTIHMVENNTVLQE